MTQTQLADAGAIKFAKTSVDPRIRDAGLLLHLLTEEGDNLVLNTSWFGDPFSAENIGGVGTRGNDLVNLVVDFIGDPVKDAPMGKNGTRSS